MPASSASRANRRAESGDPGGLALDQRERIAGSVRDLVEHLVYGLAEPAQGPDHGAVVDGLRLAGRLAHLECLEHGELVRMLGAEL